MLFVVMVGWSPWGGRHDSSAAGAGRVFHNSILPSGLIMYTNHKTNRLRDGL